MVHQTKFLKPEINYGTPALNDSYQYLSFYAYQYTLTEIIYLYYTILSICKRIFLVFIWLLLDILLLLATFANVRRTHIYSRTRCSILFF
jgi:hypothetical protein